MKTSLSLIGIFISLIILTSFSNEKSEMGSIELKNYEIPDNINAIFDQSCIMCHNKEAKNEKSKKKLLLDDIDSLSKSKFISKLSKIAEVVSKGEMPPEKFTAKYPDKKLSDDDKNTLISWSKNYAEELSKK
jgi:predicted house-cleaning noncanonical NTP pyrophosphatase (MazG superfamily)